MIELRFDDNSDNDLFDDNSYIDLFGNNSDDNVFDDNFYAMDINLGNSVVCAHCTNLQ